jgi:hypothetical protein
MKDFRDQAIGECSDEAIIRAMSNVDKDMKNEISYATINFAVNV